MNKRFSFAPLYFHGLLVGMVFLLACVGLAHGEEAASHAPQSHVTEFWVVSTRACEQGGCSCDPEEMEYSRVDACGHGQPSNLDEFLRALRPEKPACFFVHGNLTDAEVAQEIGTDVFCALNASTPEGISTTFVLFSWPSQRELLFTTLDLGLKTQRSDTNAFYLAHLLSRLPAHQRVSLVGHSLGARTVAGALELLAGGQVRGRRLPESLRNQGAGPKHAIFLAGSIDHDWLNPCERFGRALSAVERVLLVNNARDPTLAFYPLRKLFSSAALGRIGLQAEDWRRLSAEQQKIDQIDVASIVGMTHDVTFYFEGDEIAAIMVPYVYFLEQPSVATTASNP